ncbi:uncharacterized protein LOC124825620 isoform X2 [Vigna umbellata]|uniref:uncharacterized protein LOC124825620 isoform X2 n=1 Tax=Vigna umbellata TaxID=87088 RepID=UPI001F5F6488|nr:uncharacterized protein LOC124825620 isoform X2 [Vigna umbellata]
MAYGCCCRWQWVEAKSMGLGCCYSSSAARTKTSPSFRLRLCSPPRPVSVTVSVSGLSDCNPHTGSDREDIKGSGTSARGRRLLKVREEKQKREYERLHNYPAWAKVLENACKDDEELRGVLGDSIGNPELMRKRVEDRVRRKGRDFQKSKTGSVLAFKVTFRNFNPTDSYIWFELYGPPSDRDVNLIGNVIQSWYVMGRLGAYNSSNLQEKMEMRFPIPMVSVYLFTNACLELDEIHKNTKISLGVMFLIFMFVQYCPFVIPIIYVRASNQCK